MVDEIVVVDTGSVDATCEVARQFGCRLENFVWNSSFSAARNRALDLVRSDWVLYIDADERVLPCDVSAVREQLADPAYTGYEVLLRPRPHYTPYWVLRLFRSDPAIRFRGIINEYIWHSIQVYHGSQWRVGRSPLLLDHIGYEGDQARKHRRNLPLLHAALQMEPTRIYCWCHLADIHAALGEQDLADRALETALAMVRTKRVFSTDDSMPYVQLIHRGLEAGRDISSLLAEARGRFPENVQLIWLEGRSHMSSGRYELAIPLFQRLAQFGLYGEFDHSSAYDLRILGILAYDSLATCFFRLRRYEESRRYFQLAAVIAPERLDYKVKQELCGHLARASEENG